MKIKLYILLSIVLFAKISFAQDSLSLEKAIDLALQNNFGIQISKNSQTIAQINNTWQNTGAFPMLQFTANSANSAVYFDKEPAANAIQTMNTQNADYTQNVASAQIALQWVIFDGFSARITKEKLEYLEKIASGNVNVLVENTVYSTILAYYTVILQKQKLLFLRQSQELSRDRYMYQLSLQDLGVATTFEVLQAQNSWLQDTALVLQQEALYKSSVQDLKYIMADSTLTEYAFPTYFNANFLQISQDDLLKDIKTDNTQLKQKYLSLHMLYLDQKYVQANFYPTISLQAGASENWARTDYGVIDPITGSNQKYFGNLSFSYDIYSGGMKNRAKQISEVNAQIGQLEYRDLLFKTQNLAIKELDTYSSRKALYKLSVENEKASKLNFEIAQERFKNGSISSFDYRTIQIQYINASMQRLENLYLLIVSESNLLKLSGRIIKL
jgi:outer membrane protein